MPPETRSIIDYQPLPGDGRVYNPYLREVLELTATLRESGAADITLPLLERRAEFVSKYAFSIPTADTLEAVAARSPLLEIGAGTGYWAMCLSELGADIIAVDHRVPGEGSPWDITARNPWHDDTWFPVEEGDERTAALYPERSLLLCWPPPESPMALNALSHYLAAGGTTLVFIGSETSTGTDSFHAMRNSLEPSLRMELPGWPHVAEVLTIHRVRP